MGIWSRLDGYQELNQDDCLYPVQGHLIMLRNQNPEELKYMLIVNFDSEKDNKEGVFRTLDFFPKKHVDADLNHVGVLGGTFIENYNALECNAQEFDLIIDRAKRFFYQDIEQLPKQ